MKKNLPFELTGAQKRVIREIRQDMGSGRQMNRLLQGDVGSGEDTGGFDEHLDCIGQWFSGLYHGAYRDFGGAALCDFPELVVRDARKGGTADGDGERKAATGCFGRIERRRGTDFWSGRMPCWKTRCFFKSLGMVVIDEQHRFGVAQRARLWTKNSNPPHVLVMTATPIPVPWP